MARPAQADRLLRAGGYRRLIVGRCLGAGLLRVDRILLTVDEIAVKAVLDIRAGVGPGKQPFLIGLVFGE